MNEFPIETHHLNFSFTPSKKILFDVNLSVPKGSVYCFLGPNGAGKTTTLRLLLGLLKTQPNQISIFGKDLLMNRKYILERTGALIEQPSLYLHLTGQENLEVFRLSYRCSTKRIDEVLQIVSLHDARNQPVKTYSLGMKQRLAIALALLHDPELLILDEPTNGLDPEGIVDIRQVINKLHSKFNKTILVSSHLLGEVDKIATHFGIIHKGRLLFQGTKEALQQVGPVVNTIKLETNDLERTSQLLENRLVYRRVGESILHVDVDDREQIPALAELLVQERIGIYNMETIQDTLEEKFIKIIGS
jgi:lantibiotic transport system ATP-binding protein